MTASPAADRAPFERLERTLNEIVLGQPLLVRQLLVALLAGGHAIVEGVPGTGKTLLVRAIARLIQADFRRIQLTPDILPSDILGTSVFDLNARQFTLHQGPIFTEVLLADEINRTPPKTQAALLEAMEEQQATIEGNSLALPDLFWVAATQNPLEFEGTYPLPEAQLDRFLFELEAGYPNREAERQMLANVQKGFRAKRQDLDRLKPVVTVEGILRARRAARSVSVADSLLDYLLDLVAETRQHPDLALGASPRSTGLWLQAAKAEAWLAGRDYATPDDVKSVAVPLLRHRLLVRPEAQLDGVRPAAIARGILDRVAVPR